MLNAKALINEAESITGLKNFGNPLFLDGFHRLIDSINLEADLNDIGMQAQHHRLIGVLANILRLEADAEKYRNFGRANQSSYCNSRTTKNRQHHDT